MKFGMVLVVIVYQVMFVIMVSVELAHQIQFPLLIHQHVSVIMNYKYSIQIQILVINAHLIHFLMLIEMLVIAIKDFINSKDFV